MRELHLLDTDGDPFRLSVTDEGQVEIQAQIYVETEGDTIDCWFYLHRTDVVAMHAWLETYLKETEGK